MPRFSKTLKHRVWMLSGGIVAVLLVVFLIFSLQGGGLMTVDDFILIALIAAISPPAALDFMEKKWKRSNDKYIPNLLMDVATAQQTGMTFIKALEASASSEYGPLSKNLRKATAKISWGIPYDEAMEQMAQEVDTRLMRITAALINETGRIGGNVQFVMSVIANHVRDLEDLERQRITEIRPYIFIVYCGFGILLIAIGAVYLMFLKPFLPELEGIPFAAPLPLETYRRILFHTVILQGTFGGLLTGQLGEASIGAGLKHVVIMLLITFIVFRTILQ